MYVYKNGNMIDLSFNDQQVKADLVHNQDYINLVKNNATIGHIQNQVGSGHIMLFHNLNDIFTAYLLADELLYYPQNIDDIRRIANLLENFATEDYRRNNP